eukprot:scaffold225539_cov27-Tisochrysis_lutea.AAC.4
MESFSSLSARLRCSHSAALLAILAFQCVVESCNRCSRRICDSIVLALCWSLRVKFLKSKVRCSVVEV